MAYNPFRHFGLKFLSVLIATLLWIAVGGERVVERSLRAPLELQNRPEGLELVGDTPASIDVRVRGSSSTLGQLSAGDVLAVLDLSGARVGRHLFPLTPNEVHAPTGVEVTHVAPASTSLVFERSLVKKVQVVPSIEGQPAPGYAVERVITDPTDVEVIGPESAVRGLQQATTEPVSIEGATGMVSDSVTIGTSSGAVRLKSQRSAHIQVEIAPMRTERAMTLVPVRMLNLRAGLSARSTPAALTVTVRGADDTLQKLTTDALEASVNLGGLGPGSYNLAVRISPSHEFGVVSIEPSQVQIIIK